MDKTTERIKAEAERLLKEQNESLLLNETYGEGYEEGYIAGATAEHDRLNPIVDALKQFVSYHETGLLPDRFTYEKGVKALEGWKGAGKEVELSCMVCGVKFMGPEPKMCCSGRDCGCMGLPVDPIVCSEECYNKGIPPQKGDSGVVIN